MARLAAERSGLDPGAAQQVSLAVDEAATNVIEHAYGGAPDRRVEIRVAASAEELRVDLFDDGASVDPGRVPSYDLERYASEGRRGGLGVHLMGRIMDSVSYRRVGDRNLCCLVKRLGAPGPLGDPGRRYGTALAGLEERGTPRGLLRPVAELAGLRELLAAQARGEDAGALLGATLELLCRELGAELAELLLPERPGCYRRWLARGAVAASPGELSAPDACAGVRTRADGAAWQAALAALGLELVYPLRRGGDVVGLLGVGRREGGMGEDELAFLAALADFALVVLDAERTRRELVGVERKLSARVFQLHNLFELTRALTGSLDRDAVLDLVATTLLGELAATRCAIYLLEGGELRLASERGLRGECPERLPAGGLPSRPVAVAELEGGPLPEALCRARLTFAVPLGSGGLIALGERASGQPYGSEDADFAVTLGEQAHAALSSIRLQRVRMEKERQDRELEIARVIQRGLFPTRRPALPGFDVAAVSRPCYQVGGDYYDFIPLEGGRLAMVVADVAGKGAGASILMASVHAALQARAGTLEPAMLIGWLNHFLCASTQENRFVTLFYGELEPRERRLVYVNAGHVPPFREGRGGSGRLVAGGPVLGLLEGASFEPGETVLEEDELVAIVTDGVTEKLSPDELEFGEERTRELLRSLRERPAEEIVDELVGGLAAWSGRSGASDDLTALVLKAVPSQGEGGR